MSLQGASIAYGALSSCEDLVTHPQLRTIEYSLGDEAGTVITMPAPPVEVKDATWDTGDFGAVPRVGQHTAAVAVEFS